MLRMSKFAPGEFVRPWPPLPTFWFATCLEYHPRTIRAPMAVTIGLSGSGWVAGLPVGWGPRSRRS